MNGFLSANILLILMGLMGALFVDSTKGENDRHRQQDFQALTNDICADFIFLLEESTALLPGRTFSRWEDEKRFMQYMATPFGGHPISISQNHTRFGVIGYASKAEVQIDLEDAKDQSDLLQRISGLQLLIQTGTNDGRNMTDGFLKAIDQISKKRRYGIPIYVILIATGEDTENPESILLEAAGKLLDLNVKTYIVFTNDTSSTTSENQMRAIASATSGVLYEMIEYGTVMNHSSLLRDDFLNAATVEASCNGYPCDAEVAVLIDKSNSITNENYTQYMDPFLLSFASFLQPGNRVKLTIVDICDPTNTRIVLDFNSDQNIRNIKNVLQTRTCTNSETALETALNLTYSTIFSDSPYHNKFRFVVIITQSRATDAYNQSYIPAIDMLINEKKADIFTLGFGPNIDLDYLNMLQGGKWFPFYVSDIESLMETRFASSLASSVLYALIYYCPNNESTSPPPSTTTIPTSPSPDWALYCTTSTPRTTPGIIPTSTAPPASEPMQTTPWLPLQTPSSPFRVLQSQIDQDTTTMVYRNLTALLLLLSQEEITNNTADRVSQTLEFLLIELGAVMNEEDIYLTALILYRISIVYPLSDRAFGAAIESVNIILSQDEGTIRRSNFLYESTHYIQQFFYQSTAHTTSDFLIHDTTKYIFVSIQHVRCGPSSQKVVGAVQYVNGEVCIPGPGPIPWNETDVIAYIQLPTDAFCDTLSTRQKRSTTNEQFRVGSVFYRNQKLFGKEDPAATNSTPPMCRCDIQSQPKSEYVATMDVMPVDHVHDGPMPDLSVIKRPVSFGMNTRNASDYKMKLHAHESCSYWNNSLGWLSNGCKQANLLEDMYVQGCQCDHLTDFTLVVDILESDPKLCDPGISIFGLVLEILSIVGLLIAILLGLLKYFHNYLKNISHINYVHTWSLEENESGGNRKTLVEFLMSNMFLFLLLFVLLSDRRRLNLSKTGCDVSAAVLYCILMSSFLWTVFAAINYYRLIVEVFYNRLLNILVSKKVTFPVACGIPILITIIIWFTENEFYSRDDCFCWIRPNEKYIIPAVIAPTSVLVFMDLILTARVIYSFWSTRSSKTVTIAMSPTAQRRIYLQYTIALLMLQVILGLHWVAEYFTIGNTSVIAVDYVFTFFNGTQGLWLAIFYIYVWVKSVMSVRRKSMMVKPRNAPNENAADQNQMPAISSPDY